nr:four-carbon acid sugar kinase family protein [uncultured Stomatobaculum sp.]
MLRLLILADDFTGALDTGVRFAARGIPTQVVTAEGFEDVPKDTEVLVIDTETRHLSPEEAGNRIHALTKSAIQAGVSCIYKKTDSALRGNVGAELAAVLRAGTTKSLPFLPAFPQIGRTTEGGRHFINGIPVNESPFGKDPFEPVKTAELAVLIGEQSEVPVSRFPALRPGDVPPKQKGILVFDAKTEEELSVNGRVLFRTGAPRVLAGCAGFAAFLPELLGMTGYESRALPSLSPRLLVLCGSVNPITRRQLSVAADAGFWHVHLMPQEKLLPDFFATADGSKALQALREQLREHPYLIIDSNDAGENMATKNYAENLGLSLEELRCRIANALGTVLAGLIEEPALGTLLLTGGDTLLQCMNALGVRKVEPIGELESGIVLCRFSYRGKEHAVITKSGGFGEEDLLPRLARFLEKKTEGEKR